MIKRWDKLDVSRQQAIPAAVRRRIIEFVGDSANEGREDDEDVHFPCPASLSDLDDSDPDVDVSTQPDMRYSAYKNSRSVSNTDSESRTGVIEKKVIYVIQYLRMGLILS